MLLCAAMQITVVLAGGFLDDGGRFGCKRWSKTIVVDESDAKLAAFYEQ